MIAGGFLESDCSLLVCLLQMQKHTAEGVGAVLILKIRSNRFSNMGLNQARWPRIPKVYES